MIVARTLKWPVKAVHRLGKMVFNSSLLESFLPQDCRITIIPIYEKIIINFMIDLFMVLCEVHFKSKLWNT